MKCPACGFEIKKKLPEKHRSNPQNRYFHGVVLPLLSDHTGYTDEEMKGILKYKFRVKHTSSLDTKGFEEFCSQIRQWASRDLGCWIPEPNETDTYE
jgi:hypothetical protein